jgi:hypothetical protein
MKQYLTYHFIAGVMVYLLISLAVGTVDFGKWQEYTKVTFVVVMLVAGFIGYFLKQLNDDSDKL